MPHYTIKDHKSKAIIAICDAPNIVAAKAGAANLLLDVSMATGEEMFQAGQDGVKVMKFYPKKRGTAATVDPNHTDLEAQIAEAEQGDESAATESEAT